MSTFPAVIPSTRAHTPGTYPATPYTATSGSERRIRHGNIRVGQRLVLTFENITEAEWLLIRAHYLNHQPLRRSFNLSAEVVDGETLAWFDDPDYSWRYASPPECEDVQPDIKVVAVELERVPEPAETGYLLRGLAAAFVTTGRRAAILYSPRIVAGAVFFGTTGQAASVRHNKRITGAAAAFVTTGQAAVITAGGVITGEAAAFVTTGQAASLIHNKVISGSAAAFATTGNTALVLFSGDQGYLFGQAAAFTTTGQIATLTYGRVITGAAAAFTTTGQAASINYSGPYTPPDYLGSWALQNAPYNGNALADWWAN
jgi:hypothetical protein